MKTLRIYGPPEAALPFDLRDILQRLATRSLRASWRVSAVGAGYQWFDATGPGGDVLESWAQSGSMIEGRHLAAAAQDVLQIIWGEFTGFLPGTPNSPWIVIRAIDSTFYEITTDDETVLQRVETGFQGARRSDAPWKPAD
ncbi:hypothetical protein ACI2KT_07290 [Ensifer adhaerens]|uniref:hypothetical protein n=1 Tax=Ensifer adhaerens TaxID=106592 RepID=UPI00384A7E8D